MINPSRMNLEQAHAEYEAALRKLEEAKTSVDDGNKNRRIGAAKNHLQAVAHRLKLLSQPVQWG